VTRAFFDDVADILVGFLPAARTGFSHRASARNLKVWFGGDGWEHYEAQFLPAGTAGPGGSGRVLEIGFHAEYPDARRNREVLDRLRASEPRWRRRLGPEVTAGPFLGRKGWTRVSEVWDAPGLGGEEAAVEVAERLAAYVAALEPLRGAAPERTS
jgi:hypothetical protein